MTGESESESVNETSERARRRGWQHTPSNACSRWPRSATVVRFDMLVCLDALRWAKLDLHKLVPDGDKRVRRVIEAWGLPWPNDG